MVIIANFIELKLTKNGSNKSTSIKYNGIHDETKSVMRVLDKTENIEHPSICDSFEDSYNSSHKPYTFFLLFFFFTKNVT